MNKPQPKSRRDEIIVDEFKASINKSWRDEIIIENVQPTKPNPEGMKLL